MHPRRGSMDFYWPGVALGVAGVIVLLTVPLFQAGSPPPCLSSCKAACECPGFAPGTFDFAGPLLLMAAGVYSVAVFLVRHRRSTRNRPGSLSPEGA
jgi:hypothetical protein